MKLLYVNALFDRSAGGGIAERGVQLCRALVAEGTECTVLTLDIGLDAGRRRDLAGIRVTALPYMNRRFLLPRVPPGTIRRLVADADVIELCSHWTVLNALVYRAVRWLKKPYLATPAGALVMVGRSPVLKRGYQQWIGQDIIRNADAPIAVTAGELPEFEACGVSREAVTVIPNGVGIPDDPGPAGQEVLEKFGLSGRRFVLFMGRLSFIKSPDILLDAYARVARQLPGYDLVFAGPDEGMLAGLRASAATLGLTDRIHFLGYLSGPERECIYRACDLLAIPSRREAMSLVALEAGVRGKAVLITDQCGFGEIATVGGGRVVPVDPEAMGAALVAMTADAGALQAMGRALRDHVRSEYTWQRSARLHRSVCERIVSRK